MAAAVGSSTGKEGVVIGFYFLGRPHRRARPGSEKNKSFQRETKGSPIDAHAASRNQSLQRAARNRAHHSHMRSRCAALRTSNLSLSGSWSRCMRKKRKEALHEPYPQPCRVSPLLAGEPYCTCGP